MVEVGIIHIASQKMRNSTVFSNLLKKADSRGTTEKHGMLFLSYKVAYLDHDYYNAPSFPAPPDWQERGAQPEAAKNLNK